MSRIVPACCVVALLLSPGCDKKPGDHQHEPTVPSAAAEASAAAGPTGVKACDDYFAAVDACKTKVDAETARELTQTAAQYRKQLQQADGSAARDMVATGCDAAREAIAEDGCE